MLDARHRRWVVVLTALGSLMAALDTLVVAAALPTIRTDLDASLSSLEWTVNAYNLSLAVFLVPAAVLGDRIGRARTYAGGLALFALASVGCAVAPDAGTLIGMRAIQGAGGAVILTLGLVLLTTAFPAERRGEALGLLGAVTGISVAFGPLVGGLVVDGLDWQWIFWVNVPIGLLAVPLVFAFVPESHAPRSRFDLPGIALLGGGCLALVWGLVRSESIGWASLEVVGTLALGVVALLALAWWELRAPAPFLPASLLTVRGFVPGNLAVMLTCASLFSAVFFYGQLLQVALGYSPIGAGLRLMAWTGTLLLVAPLAGKLADRHGERLLLAGGLGLQAVAMVWLASAASPGVGYLDAVGPFVLGGIGVATAIPCGQSAVVGAGGETDLGTAAGVYSTMRELGGVFGIAVTVAVFGANGGYASPDDFLDGFRAAIVVAAGLSALGALAGLALPRRTPSAAPEPGLVVAA